MFNSFISLYFEAFPDVMIANILTARYLNEVGFKVAFSRSGEALSVIILAVSLFFQAIFLPITLVVMLRLSKK